MICKFCSSKMTPMVDARSLESALDCGHIAGSGLKVSFKEECPNCGAKSLSSLSPKSGLCLAEAPKQVVHSLKIFTDRLRYYIANQANYPKDLSDFRFHWTRLSPSGYIDYHDLHDQTTLDRKHLDRGDALVIEICDFSTLSIFFNGFAERELRDLSVEPRFATEKTESGDYSNYRESRQQTFTQIALSGFVNLESELDTLICGTKQLQEIAQIMVSVNCKTEFCVAHQGHEPNPWQDFFDFMFYESEYLAQENIPVRLSKNYPVFAPSSEEN